MSRDRLSDLKRQLLQESFPADEIRNLTSQIHLQTLEESLYIDQGNFNHIHPSDLRMLFDLYDKLFFAGTISDVAFADVHTLTFRLSNRMTKTGGTTARAVSRNQITGEIARIEHQITVSTTLLYQTFEDVDRPIDVTGIICSDRLEALQRVFEHELVHLLELLIWEESNCSQPRFADIASRYFGHTSSTHNLITSSERAKKRFGIKVGDQVSFTFEGFEYTGFVNRITKRATILVEDQYGTRYSDGKHYTKFYVPLGMLTKIES